MFLNGMAQGIELIPWAKHIMYKTNAYIMHIWRIFTEVIASLLNIISPRPVAAKSMPRLEVNKNFLRPYFSTRNEVNVVTVNYTNTRVFRNSCAGRHNILPLLSVTCNAVTNNAHCSYDTGLTFNSAKMQRTLFLNTWTQLKSRKTNRAKQTKIHHWIFFLQHLSPSANW